MPKLYVTPSDFSNFPASLAFPVQVAQMTLLSGAMDKLLARASRRVDRFCAKRIGAPPSTTVGTGGIAQGGTSLPVASTLGFDSGLEQAVQIGMGGTQEIVALLPGGETVSSWVSPYVGTLTLASPTLFAHSAGEVVAGCYQEVSTVGGSSSSDIYSESLLALNQAAQLAAAHAPQFDTSGLTRVIFLKCYPIVSLLRLEHMLPFDTMYSVLDGSTVGINPSSGFLRLPLGSFVLPDGFMRITYIAGYTHVPEDIQTATAWYAADELQMIVTQGAYDMLQSKRRGRYAETGQPKSRFVLAAEEILNAGYKRRT